MKKKKLTCHDCGLEDFDECEWKHVHRSIIPDRSPCMFCKRNPEVPSTGEPVFDFYSKNWTADLTLIPLTPIIEEPENKREEYLPKLAKDLQLIYGC